MPYDEELAEQVRQLVDGEPGLTTKRMFGGLAYLINGNMAVAASSKGGLMVRVDPAESDALLLDPAASRMVMQGREMDGWLRVSIEATSAEDDADRLEYWVEKGVTYARSLPPK